MALCAASNPRLMQMLEEMAVSEKSPLAAVKLLLEAGAKPTKVLLSLPGAVTGRHLPQRVSGELF
jgi:hypothetical protein